MASQVFQHPVQTMRSFCARSVGVVDGGEGGGGEHGADAVPTLPAARETWYAAALALERAFAAGPRWRRRRRWRQLLAPEWPGAEVEEGEEDQAVGRTR